MMNKICRLSNNTKDYLEQYNCILNEMIDKMTGVHPSESISATFIMQMIPHHQAAIAMSQNLLQYTTNIPLQSIAQNIVTSQKKSIENMTAVYPECAAILDTACERAGFQRENDLILKNMFCEMESARICNQIDASFMHEMIPHHRGAVFMSENALRYPLCSGLIPLLEAIIVSQKRGIREMQQLLQRIRC